MNRPWMPLYVGDYLAATRHLSAAEHGAYLLLIMHYWTAGGLPKDDRQLTRIACMAPAEWKRARPAIAAFFQDGWVHPRVDKELERVSQVSEKYAERARKAAATRWSKDEPSDASSMLEAPEPHSHSHSHPQSESEAQAAAAAPPPPPSQKIGGGGGSGSARATATPPVSQEATALASEVMKILGVDVAFKPPGWCGAAARLQAGLATGWNRELVLMAARRLAAKQKQSGQQAAPIKSFSYLEKPIAREHALAARPFPKIEIRPQESFPVYVGNRPPAVDWDAAEERVRASLRRSCDPGSAEKSPEGRIRRECGDLDAEALPGGGYRVG